MVFEEIYYQQMALEFDYPSSDNRIRVFEEFANIISNPERFAAMAKTRSFENYFEKQNRFVVLKASNSNARISAQKGLFVLPKSRDKKKINKEYSEAGVAEIAIGASIRDSVLEKLSNLGYTKAHLFFDLQNISMHIKEKYTRREQSSSMKSSIYDTIMENEND